MRDFFIITVYVLIDKQFFIELLIEFKIKVSPVLPEFSGGTGLLKLLNTGLIKLLNMGLIKFLNRA